MLQDYNAIDRQHIAEGTPPPQHTGRHRARGGGAADSGQGGGRGREGTDPHDQPAGCR